MQAFIVLVYPFSAFQWTTASFDFHQMPVHKRTTMLAHCNLKQNTQLCSKQSSFFSFYALPSGGKSKDHWSISKRNFRFSGLPVYSKLYVIDLGNPAGAGEFILKGKVKLGQDRSILVSLFRPIFMQWTKNTGLELKIQMDLFCRTPIDRITD